MSLALPRVTSGGSGWRSSIVTGSDGSTREPAAEQEPRRETATSPRIRPPLIGLIPRRIVEARSDCTGELERPDTKEFRVSAGASVRPWVPVGRAPASSDRPDQNDRTRINMIPEERRNAVNPSEARRRRGGAPLESVYSRARQRVASGLRPRTA